MSQHMNLDLQTLIDLLVTRTRDYDEMLSTRVFNEEEFTQCRQILAELHAAIKEKSEEEGYSMEKVLPSFPNKNRR